MSKMDPVMGYDPTLESWEGEDPGEAIIPEKPLEEKTADSVIDTAMDHYLDEKDGQVDTFANETNEAGFDPILGMEDLKSLEREINVGIEQLDYLLDLQERLKLAKGINRSLGLEAIERVPDFKFQSDRFFTTHTSTVNYQPSMESIGSKIKEFIAKLWEKIKSAGKMMVDLVNRMLDWFRNKLKKTEPERKIFVEQFSEWLETYKESQMSSEPAINGFDGLVKLVNDRQAFLPKLLESETIGFRNYCVVKRRSMEHIEYLRDNLESEIKRGKFFKDVYGHLKEYLDVVDNLKNAILAANSSGNPLPIKSALLDHMVELDTMANPKDRWADENILSIFDPEEYKAKLDTDKVTYLTNSLYLSDFLDNVFTVYFDMDDEAKSGFKMDKLIEIVKKDLERFSKELNHSNLADALTKVSDLSNPHYREAVEGVKNTLNYINKAMIMIPETIKMLTVLPSYQYNYYLSLKEIHSRCASFVEKNKDFQWTPEAKALVNTKLWKSHSNFGEIDKDFA